MKILEKDDPAKLDSILSSHYITKFLVDILQFSYAYYVVAEPENQEKPAKYEIFDQRKPFDKFADGKNASLVNLRFLITPFE